MIVLPSPSSILIFGFQSWTKADDIRDFQIEGISIGDSLLDYVTKKEINLSKRNYVKNKKYYVVGYDENLTIYDQVDIYLKSNDNKYIVRTLGGTIYMNKKDCLTKKKQIVVPRTIGTTKNNKVKAEYSFSLVLNSSIVFLFIEPVIISYK